MSKPSTKKQLSKKPSRFGAYIRVSTEEQSEKYSPAFQMAAIEELIRRHDGELVKAYMDDVSGSFLESRSKMQEALQDMEAGSIDTLAIYDMSRYSRVIEHQQRIRRRIHELGGHLLFCTLEYSNTADGSLAFNVSGLLAEHERLKLRERSWAGRTTAVKKGIQTQRSRPPYGYRIVTEHDVIRGTHKKDQVGTYEIIEDEAKIVRLIFEQFASGKSLRGVCRYLIENGIPTPKAQREDSTRRMRGLDGWLSSTIKSILSNTTHYGQAAFGKTRRVADESRLQNGFKNPYTVVRVPPEEWIYIDCPAIVSRELWDQCNRRLKSNNALFGGNPQRKYMLSGLLRCPKCERTMAASSRQRPYQPDGVKEVSYCCKDANPAWNMQGVVCFPHHFRGLKLEAEVITAIVGLTTDPAQLERAYEEWKRKLQPVAANAGKNIQRKLDALAKKELATAEAQIEARMKGEGTAVYDTILSSIAQQRKILLSQQEEISMARRAATDAQHVQQKIEWFAQTAKDVSEVLSAEVIEPGEKQKILSLIIEKIYPDAKGKLTIYFHPFEAGRQWVWQRGKLRVEELKPAN